MVLKLDSLCLTAETSYIIKFKEELDLLYLAYPNGILCFEDYDLCNDKNVFYPWCKKDIQDIIKKISIPLSPFYVNNITFSVCINLNQNNLTILKDAFSKYENEMELYEGDLYYIKENGEVLYRAISFVEQILAPEVLDFATEIENIMLTYINTKE